MRISDWSSDVCSSDLGGGFDRGGGASVRRAACRGGERESADCGGGHPGRRAGGGDQRPAFARGGVTILVRTKTQRREGISKSVRAELVEAPFFLTSLKKRRALRQAQGNRMLVASSRQNGRASCRERVGRY